MPEIVLDVLTFDSVPLAAPRSCRFEGDGGTIGRDEGSTLVLEDAHRRVSRLHATITFPAGVPTITNASTSLQLCVREVPLDGGQAMALSLGDMLEIGPYVLKVASIGAIDVLMQTQTRMPMNQTAELARPDSFMQSVPASAAEDPFASLLAGIGGTPAQEPRAAALREFGAPSIGEPRRAESGLAQSLGPTSDPLAALGFGTGVVPNQQGLASAGSARSTPAPSLPSDFNPFELPSGVDRNSPDPLSSLLGAKAEPAPPLISQGEPSIDALFAGVGTSPMDALSSSSAGSVAWPSAADSLLGSPVGSDPLALFGDSGSAPVSGRQPMRDDRPEVAGAYQPPRALERVEPAAAMPANLPTPNRIAAAVEHAGNNSSGALTEAFLKGANLPASVLPHGLTPEVMALVGSLLRSATAGAIDMLAARAATKLEVQASVTIISASANNPLKFLPNADAALQQLLGMRMPGFMRADEAMRDAFDDLRAHEVGVIAGTRAALAEVLGKFDPAVLGERLAGGSMLESFLPSVRKTKLWDVYLERYAQIRREAEDDFQSIFGRAFVNAYERETARMKAQPAQRGSSR